MRAKTVCILSCACDACGHGSQGCAEYPDGKIPAGTVIDHPDAYRMVKQGVAVPHDEECDRRANMNKQQQQAAQYAAKRTSLGIAPEDFPAYDRGEMVGYYGDGSSIPGPNATVSDGGIILNDDDYEDDCDVG